MEEPGRLQSMGLRTVGHDWATSLSLFTFMHWRRKWQPTPVFLPEESQGQWAAVYGVAQSRTRLKWLSSSSSSRRRSLKACWKPGTFFFSISTTSNSEPGYTNICWVNEKAMSYSSCISKTCLAQSRYSITFTEWLIKDRTEQGAVWAGRQSPVRWGY